MQFAPMALGLALAAAPAARADEIAATLRSALAAYEAGNDTAAQQDIAIAQQLLQAKKGAAFGAFLPEAPAGYTRTVNTDMNAALMMMGGGTGAEARYDGEAGSFTITMTADNPMMMGFVGMFANPALMAQMGKVTRIGSQMVLDQNGELTAVVDNRILVQASGGDAGAMMAAMQAMDFAGLANFGR
ncbi:MAG: hypothetical protein ACK4L4_00875 [Gemmobacter sp.]